MPLRPTAIGQLSPDGTLIGVEDPRDSSAVVWSLVGSVATPVQSITVTGGGTFDDTAILGRLDVLERGDVIDKTGAPYTVTEDDFGTNICVNAAVTLPISEKGRQVGIVLRTGASVALASGVTVESGVSPAVPGAATYTVVDGNGVDTTTYALIGETA